MIFHHRYYTFFFLSPFFPSFRLSAIPSYPSNDPHYGIPCEGVNCVIFFISLFTIFFYIVIFLVTPDPRISEESVTILQPSFWTHETLRVGVCDNGVRVGGSRR